ncbi:MAG: hypothetical protein Q7R50_04120 [Dehalococcoidales bacterium]|nr:hypothetical protein [Dehalococcoidales bacterium]
MKKRHSFLILLAVIFLALSAVLYFIHYLIFHDLHHIFIFGLGDLAFLPLEVFLVVLVIERILANNEKQEKLQKLNMVVGAFFSELGNFLLAYLADGFDNREEISKAMNVSGKWTRDDFRTARAFIGGLKIKPNARKVDLAGLKTFLGGKREFLLELLANPGLLENDKFTDALWAVTHVDEELEARPSLTGLPETDMEHLSGDIARAYGHLAGEWLEYVEHLKGKYPYLFSLVVRTHPFQEKPSAIVR